MRLKKSHLTKDGGLKLIPKTFDDLVWEKHPITRCYTERYSNCKYSRLIFKNGYGVSILFGKPFYSNGLDSYELAVIHNGSLTYNTNITDDVLGYISKEKVTEAMLKVQMLKRQRTTKN